MIYQKIYCLNNHGNKYTFVPLKEVKVSSYVNKKSNRVAKGL